MKRASLRLIMTNKSTLKLTYIYWVFENFIITHCQKDVIKYFGCIVGFERIAFWWRKDVIVELFGIISFNCLLPSRQRHYLNQYWPIINQTHKNRIEINHSRKAFDNGGHFVSVSLCCTNSEHLSQQMTPQNFGFVFDIGKKTYYVHTTESPVLWCIWIGTIYQPGHFSSDYK